MIKFFTFFPILGVVHLSALYFLLPPLVLRVWILWGASLVIAAGRANSNFLFFLSRPDWLRFGLFMDFRQHASLRQQSKT